MGKYSQEDRVFQVSVPSLGKDVLLLEGFSGAEHVSGPFEFTLQMHSEDDSVDPAKVLREAFVVSMRLPDGSDRYLHGYCKRFTQHGKDFDLTYYEADVVPWLDFLSLNQDCKIFQDKTVLEIIEEVFGKYDQADYENKTVGSYETREYCVQYRESDLNFVSRLMEEEGIFYFFQHTDSGHKLILADDTSAVEECAGQDEFRVGTTPDSWADEDVITEMEREFQVYTNAVTLTDYDPLQPSLDLEASASDDDHEELYDYPGKYSVISAGERYAGFLLEERAADQEIVRGIGRCRAFRSGYSFELSDHYRADTNQLYLLRTVWHTAHGGGYRSTDQETEYSNQFECMPASVPFRPPRFAIKPLVQGSQPALVVGPSGEEIYTDKYGRVKVQFYWDRIGEKNENSSCWIRVSHPWAGKGWGAVAIPRIGQEVIVDFLEGDPDRPIITGRVYNAERMPPYKLPDEGVVSGTKSDTHKGTGYNEISMDDTAGEELITVHAQYDMDTTVEHDDTQTVHNNREITVDGTHVETIKKDTEITISEGNLTTSVSKGERSEYVKKNRTAKVDGEYGLEVKEDTDIKVSSGDLNIETSSGSITEESAAGHKIKSKADVEVEGANVKTKGQAEVTVDGMKVAITGQLAVELAVGGNSVKIDPSGVTITGILVRIN
jgi:type VI secretion system secreted protein VgrG